MLPVLHLHVLRGTAQKFTVRSRQDDTDSQRSHPNTFRTVATNASHVRQPADLSISRYLFHPSDDPPPDFSVVAPFPITDDPPPAYEDVVNNRVPVPINA